MNTYNHHRIIEQFTSRVNKKHPGVIKNEDIKILREASDFTDDFAGEAIPFSTQIEFSKDMGYITTSSSSVLPHSSILTQKAFFFYHFYYDIKCENDTLILERSNCGDYGYESSMLKCLDLVQKETFAFTKILDKTKYYDNIKRFFIAINNFTADSNDGRMKYYSRDMFDSSNQSDCVAFLHAMGANGEGKKQSQEVFLEHITKCFSEFLFLIDRQEALFMLGIALHSIMDSFTPSHTGFKKFSEQDKAKHAQGDVLPFMGDRVDFDPGQYTDDGKASRGKTKIAAWSKGFNGNDTLNEIEFDMLKIFIKSYLDINDNDLDNLLKSKFGETNSKSAINDAILHKKVYSSNAFQYSEKAIKVLMNLFIEMTKKRQRCLSDYEAYKSEKKSIENLINEYWKNEYNSIQFVDQYPATNENLYKK